MTPDSETPWIAQVCLSGATVPLLAVLALGKYSQGLAEEWGQGLEEIFRGDRLPILPFPGSAPANGDTERGQ